MQKLAVVAASVLLLCCIPTKHKAESDDSQPPSATQIAMVMEAINPVQPSGLSLITVGKSYFDTDQQVKVVPKTPIPAQNTPQPKVIVKAVDLSSLQQSARQLVDETWSDDQWEAFSWIVKVESGWNPLARNGKEGACGLPQALPCSKLPEGINTPGIDQVQWMIGYIKARYDTPNQAKSWHLAHGWY